MTHVPPDDQGQPRLQLQTYEPTDETNDRLHKLAVVTTLDLTAGQYPISRVIWRQEFPDIEN